MNNYHDPWRQRRRHDLDGQARWWVGLIAAALVAVAGQAELVPEPWRHYLSIGGIVGTAIAGYMIRPPSGR